MDTTFNEYDQVTASLPARVVSTANGTVRVCLTEVAGEPCVDVPAASCTLVKVAETAAPAPASANPVPAPVQNAALVADNAPSA